MGTSEKIREIQDAGAAIWGSGSIASAIKQPEERLQNVFAVAHDAGTMRVQTNLLQQVAAGMIDPSQLSIRVSGVDALKISQQVQEAKNKQARDTRMLLAMLDDLDRIADKIDAHNDNIAKGLAALKDTYGDDYIQVVAGSVLTDEEIAGCETEDDILVLMAEKAFDDNGNLKPGFEHLDPRMIELLREVHDREKLKAEGAKLVEGYEANGGEMTPKIKEEAEAFGTKASFKNRLELEREASAGDLVDTANDARVDTYEAGLSGGF